MFKADKLILRVSEHVVSVHHVKGTAEPLVCQLRVEQIFAVHVQGIPDAFC